MFSSAPTSLRRRGARCWTLVTSGGTADVEVVAREDESLEAVLARIGDLVGTPAVSAYSGTTLLPGDLPLTDWRLRHGAVLGIGHPVPRGTASPGSGALELHVVGGADAGRTTALDNGEHVLGRGPGSVVPLHDPDVSRRHVVVQVGAGTVGVADLGSSNGALLDDRELTATAAPWRPGAQLRIGATTLEVAGADHAPAAGITGVAGRTLLRAPVRIGAARQPVEIAFPSPPAAPPPRRLAWVAVALPAVGGIALAVALDAPSFLFFALLSPLVAVASWWSDRRSGRRAHRRDLAEFADRTAAAEVRLAAAVEADVRATRRRFPDLAALTSGARRRTAVLWSRPLGDADFLTVRVGGGPGATGVVRRASDGVRSPWPATHVPVTVDLRSGGLAVVGPRARSLGVLRSVVGQLAAVHAPDVLELVLVTSAERLADWRWARWLPHLRSETVTVPKGPATSSAVEEAVARSLATLVDRRRSVQRPSAGHGWPGTWAAVVVDAHLPAATAGLLAGATDAGVTVLTSGETLDQVPVPLSTALRITGELGTHASLHVAGGPTRESVALDELPLDVAADLARDLAALTPAAGRSALPRDVRLLDVTGPAGDLTGDATGRWSRARDSLEVVLGVGAEGVERLDLCRHGPHALVAGTTGSGKSELLQSLIAGLALTQPPDRCSFLLIDYKGGAAFAEASQLPHTVGMLTDLDDATTARALRSLDAELTRRERLLAAHAAADLTQLPDDVPLARLVIVVDEFATLVEELPGFVPGLVGIAQRGRSLGVHLVLATQRPAGVVSADIRANCTLRICLRTTDEADSRDVLGGPEAAHLPLDVPGRAYVRTGSGAARVLQVARVSQPPARDDDEPVVSPWCWPAPPPGPRRLPEGESDLAGVVRHLRARATALSIPMPHRPWRPPLPAALSLSDLEAPATRRTASELLLGLVDHPDQQDQRPLTLDLADGGGWLAVGGPRSGRTTLLRSVLRQAVAAHGPDRLHVHVVDLGGGTLTSEVAELPQVGTAIGGDDPLRTVRLVHRLAEEVACRRSSQQSDEPRILLLVDGVEALCTLLDEADPARGSGEFLRLVRDGAAAGLTSVLTADRAVPGGRLAGVARQRLVLPLPDRADYAVVGVPLASVPSARPPGRALVGEDTAECQLVLPPALAPVPAPAGATDARSAPLRIPRLDPDPVLHGPVDGATRSTLRVALGPGGDEGDVLSVDLLRTGGLLVLGPPGSGRTSTLDAVVGDLAASGVRVLWLGTARDPEQGRAAGVDLADPGDPAAVTAWLEQRADEPVVVCVDDLGPAGSAPALGALTLLGAAAGVTLLAGAGGSDLSTWFQGPVAALRRARSGLLLCPAPGDADVLGIRLPRTPVPSRPGSGWLVRSGGAERVQVARRRVRPDAGQSSSSTGPISCLAYQASS